MSLANPLACTHHLCQAALASEPGATSREAFLPTYAAHLRRTIKRGVAHKEHYSFPLLGLKIVVDAGNGSGGFFATQVRGWWGVCKGWGGGAGAGAASGVAAVVMVIVMPVQVGCCWCCGCCQWVQV